MRKIHRKQTQSLESLKHSMNCISISAVTNGPSTEELMIHRNAKDLTVKLSTYFDDVSDYISDRLLRLKKKDAYSLTIKPSKAPLVLDDVKYMDLWDLPVPVVPGLSVPFYQLVSVMENAEPIVSGIYDTTLYPFSSFVGQVINDPEKLQSSSLRHEIKINDGHELSAAFNVCLKNGNKDKAKYGKVYRSHSEYLELTERIKVLANKHLAVSPDLVKDTVDKIDANLTILMKNIQDPDSSYRITPQKIKELAKACYDLANEVMFYSVYSVMLEQMVGCINLTNKAIEKQG